ncbi:hypothetical protein diail_6372 [Diaporthe ilicicola]|nr:hypothetical protein diail_6372 [Diaporthe ilicicola]
MESPGESSVEQERRPSQADADVADAEATSAPAELKSAVQDLESVSSEDQETNTEALLKIAAAVERIHSHLRLAYNAKNSPPSPGPEITWYPEVERLALPIWTSSNYLALGGMRQKNRCVMTAFYTERPEPTDPDVDTPRAPLSDDDFMAAYSKDNWNTVPQRILIQSRLALDELQQITKVPQRARPLGMVPPFKLLVHHRNAIKLRLDELQQKNLDNAKNSDPTREHMIAAHLQCIYNFIQTDLGNYVGLELKIRQGEIKEVSFEEVYHLFKPGDLVLSAATGQHQLYQVHSVTGGRRCLSDIQRSLHVYGERARRKTFGTGSGTWTDVKIESYIMGWDGENIGPMQRTHAISYFAGARRVTDLDIYPIQFHDNPDELRSRLRARGKKLVQCSGHKRYTGPLASPLPPLMHFLKDKTTHLRSPPRPLGMDSSDDSGDEEERHVFSNGMVRSDVYIDYKTLYSRFFATNPGLSKLYVNMGEEAETIENLGHNDQTWNFRDHEVDAYLSDTFLSTHRHLTKYGKPKQNLDDDGDRLELLPSQVPAFIFGSREWKFLNVDDIEDLDKSHEARNSGWDDLVIPKKFSGLLLSLVNNHISGVSARQWETSTPSFQIDLVRGKGRGLIILLHGPPGSGKTSTAETIAAYTGRPLYAITCGDIGIEPEVLERNLIRHSRLAEKWGCVLLLDEADVFLMSRTYDNMYRNAMVSVFLRQLEYYSGILFLTTNIVGVIDEAFKSRIHVALEYPAVDEKSTIEIWSNLLQRISRDNKKAEVKIRFDEDALLKFAKNHYRKHQHNGRTWNGRQIRNAFQTAIGIGQHERLKKIDEAVARGEIADKSTRYIRLSVKSFETVAETASDFEKYITKTRGDDRERAALHQYRQDDHSRERPPKKNYRTSASTYHTDQDTGVSRAGRSKMKTVSRDSRSPASKHSVKGKEVHRKTTRRNRHISGSDEDTGPDASLRLSDGGSDSEIIEQDLEDEDEDT